MKLYVGSSRRPTSLNAPSEATRDNQVRIARSAFSDRTADRPKPGSTAPRLQAGPDPLLAAVLDAAFFELLRKFGVVTDEGNGVPGPGGMEHRQLDAGQGTAATQSVQKKARRIEVRVG